MPYDADSIWNHDLLEPAEQPEDSSERGVKDTIYLLGRFCHSRTQLFHKLHHFPFHLYDKVKRKVQNTSGSPVEITEELMANQAWVSEVLYYNLFWCIVVEFCVVNHFGVDACLVYRQV